MAALEPGSVFAGQYRVIRKVGSGGMGAVYEAEQLSTRKRRALKVLGSRVGSDAKAQARFVREATICAEIDSAHVVDVIGAGVDEETERPWLAMELLDGVDLKRLHKVRGRFEPAHLCAVFEQLGHGLAAAHAAGVVHRDLKPENVFVARSRRAGGAFIVKILDFGIAKITREAVVNSDTATIGSPMWMAPEQINAEALSARTDVWALGLLAFWALTGRVYWTAAYGKRVTVQALFAEQLFSGLIPPSARADAYGVADRIPQGFDAWFARCVVREPADRFEGAEPAMQALLATLDPWRCAAGPSVLPLLPDRDVPTPDERVNSGPALSPIAASAEEGLARMAGTTAEMVASDAFQPTVQDGLPPTVSRPVEQTHARSLLSPPDANEATPREPPPSGSRGRRVGSGAAMATKITTAAFLVGGAIAVGIFASSESEPSPTPSPMPSSTPSRTHPVEPRPPTEARETPPTGEVDLQSLPVPSSLRALGWSSDGHHAVLRVGFGSKVAAHGVANFLELVLVVDGEGGVVESYVVDRVVRASVGDDDPLVRAAASSFTAEQWLRRQTELSLRRPDPRRVPARRRGEFSLSMDEAPGGTRVQVRAKRAGFDVSWWGFEDLRGEHTTPAIRLSWSEERASTVVFEQRVAQAVPFLRELALRARDPVVLSGHVRPYWAPAEDKALLLVDLKAGAGEQELADRRWFIVPIPAPSGAPADSGA